jgi:(p)ppGpp synthase/HD superfamily hydrolase
MNLMASNSTMPILGRPLDEAFIYAAQKHAKQRRKGTEIPYLAHLMAVASLVLEAGGDEELAIAALLHDVVEDQGGAPTLEEVRRKFGERVAKIVDECSDTDVEPKPPWEKRKKDYLRRLRGADADTMLVSVADKLHNVRSILTDHRKIGEKVWDRFKGKKEGTLWYYDALNIEFKRLPNDLTPEFEIALTQLHEAAELSKA